MNTYDYDIQELWDIIKRPNLRIHGMEGAKIQIKGIGNQFNELIVENFTSLCNNTPIHVQEAFQTINRHNH
jgi:hypothetical protein